MAPKVPAPILKTYKTVQLVTIWWENNDFGDDLEINIKQEVTAWRDWVNFNIEGAKKPKDLMIPKALKGNGPEQWLADQLKAIYIELETPKAPPALLIILYSGHGYAVRDASFSEWLEQKMMGYNAHTELRASLAAANAKPQEPLALFWSDRSSPKACIDWSWVSANLRPPSRLDHWLIYDTCFAGNAIFAGTKDKRGKEPRFPVNQGILHSFCAVGPALKRQSRFRKPNNSGRVAVTGPNSFNKIVLNALMQLHGANENPTLISSVWRAISSQDGFQDMLGLAAQVQAMTEDELLENLFKDEATPKKLLKQQVQMLRTPFYGTVPAGLADDVGLQFTQPKDLSGTVTLTKGKGKEKEKGKGKEADKAPLKDSQPVNARKPPVTKGGAGAGKVAADKKAAKPVEAAVPKKNAVKPAPKVVKKK